MNLNEKLKSAMDGSLPEEAVRVRIRDKVLAEAEKTREKEARKQPFFRRKQFRVLAVTAAALLLVGGGIFLWKGAGIPDAVTVTTARGETFVFPAVAGIGSNSLVMPACGVETRQITSEETAQLYSRTVFWRESGAEGTDLVANNDLVFRWRVSPDGTKTVISDRYDDPPRLLLLSDSDPVPVSGDDAEAGPDAETEPGEGSSPAEDDPAVLNGTFRRDTGELIRAEGHLGNVKLTFAAPGEPLSDTVLMGEESETELDGIPLSLGSFLTGPNSRGEKTLILYARFETQGSAPWQVQAEIGGDLDDPKTAAVQLICAVRSVLAAEGDFSRITADGQ